jgi:hypothetical protein
METTTMARGEITGQKPRVSRDRARRRLSRHAVSKAMAEDVAQNNAESGEDNEHSDTDLIVNDDCDGDHEPTPYREPASTVSAKRPPIRGPPTPAAAYSIAAFCVAHDISESFYFKLREQGLGPREMRVGARVLISLESAERWRRERESTANT